MIKLSQLVKSLAGALIILSTIDLVTTIAAVSLLNAKEMNLILRWLIDAHGLWIIVPYKIAAMISAITLLYAAHQMTPRYGWTVMLVPIGWSGFVVSLNFQTLLSILAAL